MFLLIKLQNLQGLYHKKWKKKREKGLLYNGDKEYTKGHKCDENKLFYIDCEEEEENEQENSKEEDIH